MDKELTFKKASIKGRSGIQNVIIQKEKKKFSNQ